MRGYAFKTSTLYCSKCGKPRIIYRKKGKMREKFHIKHMWCFNCNQKIAHMEIPDGIIDLATAHKLMCRGSKVEVVNGEVLVRYDLDRYRYEKKTGRNWIREVFNK